ncbi:MAG TPA: hypothetical protein VHY08_05145 [Bacillota bacterium]|nr:hypothetical protein [Bacillota bacterium]
MSCHNKDVLEKAGAPLPPTDYKKGWTWDRFVEYCKKITTDKNGKHPGDSGFDPDKIVKYGVSYQLWHAMLLPSLWSNNGDFITPDGKQFKLDSKESVVDSMQVARVHMEVKVKNFPDIRDEAVEPELDKVWAGEKTAADAMKSAKERINQLKLLQGNY